MSINGKLETSFTDFFEINEIVKEVKEYTLTDK